jgi:hypothetical protein
MIEREQHRAYRLVIGENLESAEPGFAIRGITVDNRSGSWLWISELEQYVPPYTLGWRRGLRWVARTINVRFVTAPRGTIPSTEVGEPVYVWLANYDVTDDEGTQVIAAREPEIFITGDNLIASAAPGYQESARQIDNLATESVRLYMLEMYNDVPYQTGSQRVLGAIYCNVHQRTPSGSVLANPLKRMLLTPNKEIDHFIFPGGRQLPVGYDIVFRYGSRGAGTDYHGFFIYTTYAIT